MATVWMRGYEVTYNYQAGDWQKLCALFVRYVLNYSFQSEVCDGGTSFVSTEKNGTAGAFTGGNRQFTETGAFAATDVGKWLIVRDTANPENAGCYRITKYVNANTIEVDFATLASENPTASTGLNWWIWGDGYQVPYPDTNYEVQYVRLQSPHSTGWAIELESYSAYNQAWPGGLGCRVSLDGSWSAGGKILREDYDGEPTYKYPQMQDDISNGGSSGRFLIDADTGGEWLRFFLAFGDEDLNNHKHHVKAFGVNRITPTDTGKSDEELTVLFGPAKNISDKNQFLIAVGSVTTQDFYAGRVLYWSDRLGKQVRGCMVSPSFGGQQYAYTHQMPDLGGVASRGDSKPKLLGGVYVIGDYDNDQNDYHVMGKLKGTWMCFSTMGDPGAIIAGAALNWYQGPVMVLLNSDSAKDKMMIADGFTIPWNGMGNP